MLSTTLKTASFPLSAYFRKLGLIALLSVAVSSCGGTTTTSGGDIEPTEPEAVVPDYEAQVVGPNLNGDDWRGHLKSVEGAFDAMTAVINHVGNKVTIQTSRPAGVAHKMSGIIDAVGNLFIIDEHDGEDWTTLYGAVSKNSINLADYVFAGESQVDTNIIILKRNQGN